jgi:hypothetical protein
LVNRVNSKASEESSRRNVAVVAAEMMPGAIALKHRAAIRPGHRPSACHTGHTTSGTSVPTRAQSVRASASISSATASGHSSGRAAADRFWNTRLIASEKGRSVVARPPMRRKT